MDEPAPRVAPRAREAASVRGDAAYLLTGGLGALGLAVASWLVAQGARHLVLWGRRSATPEAAQALDRLRETGATVVTMPIDVTNAAEVAAAFAEIRRSAPPLRGIFHAAGLLEDGVLAQLDRARFAKVMAPKLQGTQNLHAESLDLPLDFFVMFSSAASVLGPPGQGNYAAANAFMDAFAAHRRRRGLAALSINWGPWSDIGGLASRPGDVERLAARGLGPHTAAEGIAALAALLPLDAAQVGVMALDGERWSRSYPTGRGAPRFSLVSGAGGGAAPAAGATEALSRDAVLGAGVEGAGGIVGRYLVEKLARVLRLPAARLRPEQSLKSLGLDSLMAVELKNRIEIDLGVRVSITKILLEGASVAELSKSIVDGLFSAGPGAGAGAPERHPAPLADGEDCERFEL